MPPSSPGVARQRLMAVAAGLGVAAIAAAAFVLSYDDLRVLALAGGAPNRYAPVYPVMIDTLVVVTILSLVAARRTRWWARGVRWLLLLALLAGAAAASAQRAVKGYDPLPDKWLTAGVAVAPWVLLLLAAWLWLSMFRQARLLFARPGAGVSRGAIPPSGTVRVMPTRQEETEQFIPGLAAPAGAAQHSEPALEPPPEPEPEPARPPAAERPLAPATLPTDIKLVTHRPASAESGDKAATETTQPDLVMPSRASSDAPTETEPTETEPTDRATKSASTPNSADEEDDDDVERWSALAAEDAERWAEEAADHFSGAPRPDPASTPPASKFRSSPTPPRD